MKTRHVVLIIVVILVTIAVFIIISQTVGDTEKFGRSIFLGMPSQEMIPIKLHRAEPAGRAIEYNETISSYFVFSSKKS